MGVFAFTDDVDDEASQTCCQRLGDKIKNDIIVVDQMHIPLILLSAWLLLGTFSYYVVQGWTPMQSLYFMLQASRGEVYGGVRVTVTNRVRVRVIRMRFRSGNRGICTPMSCRDRLASAWASER